ncbi:hypothetical protein Slin15195_G121340 [Septoria linicola]|uniref:Uncharacterized protein n=1 Tax=Septoria linicola TaxID=215465 RepID=A0A9Q9EQ70_9PEZI|nr:hypothetical protein Slin14017_G098350 [Septoria linicola]USW58815.1 hypothetical protein Slin15195_G121340 [Septoria linicola]
MGASSSRQDSLTESVSAGTINPADVMPKGKEPASGAAASQFLDGVPMPNVPRDLDLPSQAFEVDEQGRFRDPGMEGLAITETVAQLPEPTGQTGTSGLPVDWEQRVGAIDEEIVFPG